MTGRKALLWAVVLGLVAAGITAWGAGWLGSGGQAVDLTARLSDAELERVELGGERQGSAEDVVLTFGFDLRSSPEEDARQYLPFLTYLERATGYRFRLHLTSSDGELFRELGENLVDIAAVGAVSYIKAREEYGAVALARGLNPESKATYRAVIVAAPDSDLDSLGELRGRRLAFGSIDSTQGHIIPRIALLEEGIALEDLAGYEFTGSHQSCANAVLSGRFDACGLQDTMGQALAEAGQVRIVYTSPEYPSSGVAASRDVPAEVLDRLRQALLDFDPGGRHRDGLYNWGRTEMPNGFALAQEGDYRELRDAMRQLDMLD
jgi:phosphonate transport system substrate-binding protein